jgi:hypothetical protein
VKHGRRVTGTVTLTAVTHSSVGITLTSSDPNTAPVPGGVTTPSGGKSATFTFNAGQVAKSTRVTVEGSYNGVRKSVNLTVNP